MGYFRKIMDSDKLLTVIYTAPTSSPIRQRQLG
jgi:hypothetical protein